MWKLLRTLSTRQLSDWIHDDTWTVKSRFTDHIHQNVYLSVRLLCV